MSTFSGNIGPEEEDGGGWGGLVESKAERREREARERELHKARLQGRLDAYAKAMTECSKTAQREGGSVGARHCGEIRTAIEILHLATLQELVPSRVANVEVRGATRLYRGASIRL